MEKKICLIFTDYAKKTCCFAYSRLPIFFVRSSCEEISQSIPIEQCVQIRRENSLRSKPCRPALLGRLGIPKRLTFSVRYAESRSLAAKNLQTVENEGEIRWSCRNGLAE